MKRNNFITISAKSENAPLFRFVILCGSSICNKGYYGSAIVKYSASILLLKANAEMVLKIPSCHCMLLMKPSRIKFGSNR